MVIFFSLNTFIFCDTFHMTFLCVIFSHCDLNDFDIKSFLHLFYHSFLKAKQCYLSKGALRPPTAPRAHAIFAEFLLVSFFFNLDGIIFRDT